MPFENIHTNLNEKVQKKCSGFVGLGGSARKDTLIKLKTQGPCATDPALTFRFQRDFGWSLARGSNNLKITPIILCTVKLPPRFRTLSRFAVCVCVAKPATLKCQRNKMMDRHKLHAHTHTRMFVYKFQTIKTRSSNVQLRCVHLQKSFNDTNRIV